MRAGNPRQTSRNQCGKRFLKKLPFGVDKSTVWCKLNNMKATKLDRRFGKCRIQGCKTRKVVDGFAINGTPIFFDGINRDALIAIGAWCADHDTFLNWNQLKGRVNPDKDCNGVCMAGVGPACDCACGGQNHGKNHI